MESLGENGRLWPIFAKPRLNSEPRNELESVLDMSGSNVDSISYRVSATPMRRNTRRTLGNGRSTSAKQSPIASSFSSHVQILQFMQHDPVPAFATPARRVRQRNAAAFTHAPPINEHTVSLRKYMFENGQLTIETESGIFSCSIQNIKLQLSNGNKYIFPGSIETILKKFAERRQNPYECTHRSFRLSYSIMSGDNTSITLKITAKNDTTLCNPETFPLEETVSIRIAH
jgi:hypothetical protein